MKPRRLCTAQMLAAVWGQVLERLWEGERDSWWALGLAGALAKGLVAAWGFRAGRLAWVWLGPWWVVETGKPSSEFAWGASWVGASIDSSGSKWASNLATRWEEEWGNTMEAEWGHDSERRKLWGRR